MFGSRHLIAGLLLGALLSPVAADDVMLGTNVSDFEQFYNRGGGSIEHVQCIFSKLGYSPVVQRMPWRRARQEVSTGRIDGFFTAIASVEVDKYATLSAPLLLENWYWYWPSGTDAPENWRGKVRIGAILGSHQAVWLDQNNYPIHLRVSTLPQLVKLMISGRIDTFIADREHMEAVLTELGVAPDQYQRRFLRYMPLGVYFGNEFLAEHPGFLARFNAQVFPCASSGFVMSADEQAEIHHWLTPVVRQWLEEQRAAQVIAAYNEQRKDWTPHKRDLLDEEWREAFQAGNEADVARLLDGALSDQLRMLEVDSEGLVTELILTDRQGHNVAVSDMTSDFWQGDESKFTEARKLEPGQLQFGPVTYDESTRQFQVHVSRPVYDPESAEPLGVIIVGVNVEKALSRSLKGQ